MAGTDEDAVAAADDALYVLTAVLLTPAKFPSVLGDDYPEACAALGLAPLADGYGLVIGQDGGGARWTVVIDDVSLVAVAIASWDCGMEYDLSPDERTVVAALPGWPLAVAVAAPGVPAPHDPDPEAADGPALAPPDTSTWGSAQRRLGADEIALQWATWREQIDDADFPSPNGGSAGDGAATEGRTGDGVPEAAVTQDADASARADSEDKATGGTAPEGRSTQGSAGEDGATADSAAGHSASGDAEKETRKGHSGVRRVLAEARAYVDSPPPLGRVRSSFASGDARTLRADGPGWSLVARTDDIAFVLLDDEPGEVLPVGRGPELPGLLEALDKMAVRPS
ncbi:MULTISPECIES: hypothetical protein [unclassified Streptomyces]|uniref:hypothetical protein n=1 Tax=unclassified Streptomyces TaxID=2593676 RepID=UPI0024731557|nr:MULTISPECIES: hypothetical protein [unclassified Streptomyces]MDH6448024.1 hypothetical protein [Streptomyces sp. SAI-119]MDH6501254.1 hypothetical protein [Streptomyces sp. SAI-149]